MSDDGGARAEKRGGALTLTVDRPRALNALNSGVIEFFHDALDSDARFVRAGTFGRFERCSYAVTRRVRSRFSRESLR